MYLPLNAFRVRSRADNMLRNILPIHPLNQEMSNLNLIFFHSKLLSLKIDHAFPTHIRYIRDLQIYSTLLDGAVKQDIISYINFFIIYTTLSLDTLHRKKAETDEIELTVFALYTFVMRPNIGNIFDK